MNKKIIYGILMGFIALSSCAREINGNGDGDTLIVLNKAAFFGNSLLAGFVDYGMAASQYDKDYYYLITTYLTTLNPSFTATKNPGAGFESLTNSATIDATIKSTFVDKLSGNEDLVVIQLGDNVNTPEKNAVFAESSLKLCQAVRAKSPNAKVVWMGMWYGSSEKYQAIKDACTQTGCIFITFIDLATDGAKNKVGNLTKKGKASRTLDNVTKVVTNTPTNITVTFIVEDKPYNTTLEVFSHMLNSGTLTYSSEYEIISSRGVASHPNDNGFRLITNRFLYQLKLANTDEYYKSVLTD